MGHRSAVLKTEVTMNKLVSKIGSAIVSVSVLLFAIFLLTDFSFGSFFVCMFLPIGYIMMTCGFCSECKSENKVCANVGMIFATIYATFIFIVYFAQTTTVRLEPLSEQARTLLSFKKTSLLFNYDLLGYGMMALSTFFIGLTIEVKSKKDKWLKVLMMIHGVFFVSCFFMPMTGIFANGQSESNGGVIALFFWCVYFLPIGILSFFYFK